MKPRIQVFHVNDKNYNRIISRVKTKEYRNIISNYTELFCELFDITVNEDFQLIKDGVMIENTEPIWIKFRKGYRQERYPTDVNALVSLSVGYGSSDQFSNPEILYYVLDILELKETE